APVSVNGFVMPHFHGERVKERVYLPAWHESEARLRFTNACVDVLAQLAPGGSVSVPFGALKPVAMEAVAGNSIKAGEHAARQVRVLLARLATPTAVRHRQVPHSLSSAGLLARALDVAGS